MIDLETNDIAYLSSKRKRDSARAAIMQARQALERAAEEVDNYLEKFRDADTDTEKATAVNRCIHYLDMAAIVKANCTISNDCLFVS